MTARAIQLQNQAVQFSINRGRDFAYAKTIVGEGVHIVHF